MYTFIEKDKALWQMKLGPGLYKVILHGIKQPSKSERGIKRKKGFSAPQRITSMNHTKQQIKLIFLLS